MTTSTYKTRNVLVTATPDDRAETQGEVLILSYGLSQRGGAPLGGKGMPSPVGAILARRRTRQDYFALHVAEDLPILKEKTHESASSR